jgi:hypothetical protein
MDSMNMELVTKNSPRGEFVRTLKSDEREAIINVYGLRKEISFAQLNLAQSVLEEMRKDSLWLKCDCNQAQDAPLSSAQRNKNETLYLRKFYSEHSTQCELYNERLPGNPDGAIQDSAKAACKRIDFQSFLPKDESQSRVRTGSGNLVRGKSSPVRRIPALGRLLLELIEKSELNRLNPVNPTQILSWDQIKNKIKTTSEKITFSQKRTLSEIVHFDPWISDAACEKRMDDIEESADWPDNCAHVFYQIFISKDVDEKKVVFKGKHAAKELAPAKRIRINGESQTGKRGAYWVIILYRRNSDGEVICSEGYAHALYKDWCPIPVDSKLESKTIKSIQDVAADGRIKGKIEITLEKPLFDIEVTTNDNVGYVLPDFIITVRRLPHEISKIYIIETMGYKDVEYIERKAKKHEEMKMLGDLLIDPPDWPGEGKTSLDNHLFDLIKDSE